MHDKINIKFSYYIYFFSRHVSADYVPIIRRNNCIYATFCTCYSVWMTGIEDSRPPCVSESHRYRITSTKCRINTVVSPDDGHIVTRNMSRKEINILRKIVHQFRFIYKIIQGCSSTKHKILQYSQLVHTLKLLKAYCYQVINILQSMLHVVL